MPVVSAYGDGGTRSVRYDFSNIYIIQWLYIKANTTFEQWCSQDSGTQHQDFDLQEQDQDFEVQDQDSRSRINKG